MKQSKSMTQSEFRPIGGGGSKLELKSNLGVLNTCIKNFYSEQRFVIQRMKPEESQNQELLRFAQDDETNFPLKKCNVFSLLGRELERGVDFVVDTYSSVNKKLPSPDALRHPLPREGNKVSCAEHTKKNLFTCLPIHLFTFKKAAFTLAEVLITLAIIGVVAAMTLPTLISNHQKQVTLQKLKKAYSTLGQMLVKSSMDNGSPSEFLGSGETVTVEKTKKFFEIYWLPYLNNPLIANRQFYNQGAPYKYYYINGNIYNVGLSTDYGYGRILFKTQDGIIYFVSVMAWQSKTDETGNEIDVPVYASNQEVYIDVNGTQNPNTLGKDVFIFIVNYNKNNIEPKFVSLSENSINEYCITLGTTCAAKIIRDGWKIKDDYPWK